MLEISTPLSKCFWKTDAREIGPNRDQILKVMLQTAHEPSTPFLGMVLKMLPFVAFLCLTEGGLQNDSEISTLERDGITMSAFELSYKFRRQLKMAWKMETR